MSLLERFVSGLLNMLDTEPITGRLWIVEAGRIRVHDNTMIDPNEALLPGSLCQYSALRI